MSSYISILAFTSTAVMAVHMDALAMSIGVLKSSLWLMNSGRVRPQERAAPAS